MKRVVFSVNSYNEIVKEVVEFEDGTTEDDIEKVFLEWTCEQCEAEWYPEEE